MPSDTTGRPRDEHSRLDSHRLELTRTISALQKDYYGRGPAFARAYINDDAVVVLMRGGYSKAEQTLFEAGRGQAVIDQRMAFQEVIRPIFTAEIERILGRRVIAVMSGSHQNPDLLSEIFVLETLEAELFRDIVAEEEGA